MISKNGYQIFPSGLIFQWGVYDPFNSPDIWQSEVRERVTFPTPFSHECFNVWTIPEDSYTGSTGHAWFYATNVDKNGFNIPKGRVGWFAIGY